MRPSLKLQVPSDAWRRGAEPVQTCVDAHVHLNDTFGVEKAVLRRSVRATDLGHSHVPHCGASLLSFMEKRRIPAEVQEAIVDRCAPAGKVGMRRVVVQVRDHEVTPMFPTEEQDSVPPTDDPDTEKSKRAATSLEHVRNEEGLLFYQPSPRVKTLDRRLNSLRPKWLTDLVACPASPTFTQRDGNVPLHIQQQRNAVTYKSTTGKREIALRGLIHAMDSFDRFVRDAPEFQEAVREIGTKEGHLVPLPLLQQHDAVGGGLPDRPTADRDEGAPKVMPPPIPVHHHTHRVTTEPEEEVTWQTVSFPGQKGKVHRGPPQRCPSVSPPRKFEKKHRTISHRLEALAKPIEHRPPPEHFLPAWSVHQQKKLSEEARAKAVVDQARSVPIPVYLNSKDLM